MAAVAFLRVALNMIQFRCRETTSCFDGARRLLVSSSATDSIILAATHSFGHRASLTEKRIEAEMQMSA